MPELLVLFYSRSARVSSLKVRHVRDKETLKRVILFARRT